MYLVLLCLLVIVMIQILNRSYSLEICGNSIDENCNNTQNGSMLACTTYFRDADGDGFGDSTITSVGANPVALRAVTAIGDDYTMKLPMRTPTKQVCFSR